MRRLGAPQPGRDAQDGVVQPSIEHSFYKNAYGEVYGPSPWRLVGYWTWTRERDPDDFVFG
jgi:4-hydroxyacetophenone monooxygenase